MKLEKLANENKFIKKEVAAELLNGLCDASKDDNPTKLDGLLISKIKTLKSEAESVAKIQIEKERMAKQIRQLEKEKETQLMNEEKNKEVIEKLNTQKQTLLKNIEQIQKGDKEAERVKQICKKWEEKCESITLECDEQRRKNSEIQSELEDNKIIIESYKLELGKLKEKQKLAESQQIRIEVLEEQLKVHQDEIETYKKRLEDLKGILESEEAKNDCLAKSKENDMQEMQKEMEKYKNLILELEEMRINRENFKKELAGIELELIKERENNKGMAAEREEFKKYAETLLSRLKKQDSEFANMVYTT